MKDRSDGNLLFGGHELDLEVSDLVSRVEYDIFRRGEGPSLFCAKLEGGSLSSSCDFSSYDLIDVEIEIDFTSPDGQTRFVENELDRYLDFAREKIVNKIKLNVIDKARREYTGFEDSIKIAVKTEATLNGSTYYYYHSYETYLV